MPSPVFLAYDPGETFSSINTLTLGAGIAWGTCMLAYRTIDFRRERLDETGWFVDTFTDQDIYDQFCRLTRSFQEQLYLPRQTTTKSVSGVSIGLSAGGALDMFDNICEEMLRPLLRELFSNGIGLSSNIGGMTVGTAGGFNQMFDAGAFHGMNGQTDFSLTPERIASYDYCLIQAGVGAVVSAAFNLVLLGDFRSLQSALSNEMNAFEKVAALCQYLYDVFSRARAYVLIGEAQTGVILPGGSLNIVGT